MLAVISLKKKHIYLAIFIERGKNMTQQELRDLYNQRILKEKQTYISSVTKIHTSYLSRFKKGKIDLCPVFFERLKAYLTQS